MDNNINFSELWKKQSAEPVSTEELLKKVKGLKNSSLRRLILTTVAFSATSAFILWVWMHYQPEMYSTKLGIILIILAMGIFGYSYNQQYPLLKKLDATLSNAEYLQTLIELKKKQQFQQSFMLTLYFIMLSVGIFIYMIEPARKMTLIWAIFTYAITTAWMLFNWFFIRPRTIKKQMAKIDEVIQKFDDISGQMQK